MHHDEIEKLLPAVFQLTAKNNRPMAALLEVMEKLQEPRKRCWRALTRPLIPRRTSDEFVPYLAYWADLTRLFDDNFSSNRADAAAFTLASGVGRLRELIANAGLLSKWRGTRKGLLLFLRIATGMSDFEIAENVTLDGLPKPFHITVRIPKGSEKYRALIARIVELEKPAYVTHEISACAASG